VSPRPEYDSARAGTGSYKQSCRAPGATSQEARGGGYPRHGEGSVSDENYQKADDASQYCQATRAPRQTEGKARGHL